MTEIKKGYISVPDPIYTASTNEIPINRDTICRKTIEVAPNTSAMGTLAVPINNTGGVRYQFNIPLDGFKVRWGNLALRLKMVLCCVNGSTVTDLPMKDPSVTDSGGYYGSNWYEGYYTPDPFMTFGLFDQVIMKMNNQSVIYQSTSGTVQDDCIARILQEYSFEAINNALSGCIFGPIGDHQYSPTRSYIYTDPTAPADYLDPYYSVSSSPHVSKLLVSGATSALGKEKGITAITGCAPVVEDNPYNCDPCLKQRLVNWAIPKGSASRIITRTIPFNVLFPRMPDLIFNNAQRIVLELSFSQKGRALLVPTCDAPQFALGAGVSVIEMQVLLDCHELAPAQNVVSTQMTHDQMPDYIPLPMSQTFIREWQPNGETQLAGISNFQSIFVYAPTNGINNAPWVTANYTTAAELRVCSASFNNTFSQFLPFSSVLSNNMVTDDLAPLHDLFQETLKCDIIARRARDCKNPLNGCQILWGRQLYPQNSCKTSDNQGLTGTYTWNGTQLYYEHSKAQDRVCNRVFGSSIPDDVFNTTMPHILFNPNASGPATLNNRDSVIRVKFEGGDMTYLPMLRFVLTSLLIKRMLPSGEIQTIE